MATEALKPQDILVACQLLVAEQDKVERVTHGWLGKTLYLSPSTVFESLQRCRQARLITNDRKEPRVNKVTFFNFMVHGFPTFYYPTKGTMVRGIATATFSPLFKDRFTKAGDTVIVWPYSKGTHIGIGLEPIYPSIPIACSHNPKLYQLVSAIEVLRVGKMREKRAVEKYLADYLEIQESDPIPELPRHEEPLGDP